MVTHDVDEALLLGDRIVMMTNGPAATVGEILTVDFPRPRRRFELFADARFEELRNHLLSFLEDRANIRPGDELRPQPASAVVAPGGDRPDGRVLCREYEFILQKYSGFNLFRAKYRNGHAEAKEEDA
jgi:hypothetical protein